MYTEDNGETWWSATLLNHTINVLNFYRDKFLKTKDKKYWWQLIQLLPSSYNQKRTVQLNYQVLKSMYFARKNHKLDEWHTFCDWIRTLPHSELIIDDTE
jgi:5'(3')-deoxyribonucleotidase